MRQFVLDYLYPTGIILLIAPAPLVLALIAWVFKMRFCNLHWEPFCDMLFHERFTKILAISTCGLNLMMVARVAERGSSEWLMYAYLLWAVVAAATMAYFWWRLHMRLRKELHDPQLELPMWMPHST